mmetsp:Transcript_10401/g.27030  ORF Transcript_10401/g.27030 Transcript_10401/m.27030 type:complete len:361 (+) Transcript_10401:70-1152(+)
MPRLDTVRKRLREVEALKAKLAEGQHLEASQLKKIELEVVYAAELARLEEAAVAEHERLSAQSDGIPLRDFLGATREPLLPVLERLQEQDQLRSVLKAWAARNKSALPLASPEYKLRSVDTALQHMRELHERGESPQVVLYGDSMFERMSTHFNGAIAKQLGAPGRTFVYAVGGDGVEHLLLRLHLSHDDWFATARAYVIDIGANNVLGGATRAAGVEATSTRADAAAIVAAIQHVIDFVRARCLPGAAVYVCHVLHVYGSSTLQDVPSVNRTIDELNQRIDTLTGCQVVSLRMARDTRNYVADGLHLSRVGYALFARQLLDAIPELRASASMRASAEPVQVNTSSEGLGGQVSRTQRRS